MADGDSVAFAVTELRFYDIVDGARTAAGFGLDLDGRQSTRVSDDLCRRVKGAACDVQQDGPAGVDNSYGVNVLPLYDSATATSKELLEAMAAGEWTLLIRLRNDPMSASAAGLSGALLNGAPLGAAPALDGSDPWRPTFESVVAGDPDAPTVALSDSYIVNGVWVGTADRMDLPFGARGTVPVRSLTLVADLSDETPRRLQNGVLAGFILAEDLVAEALTAAPKVDPRFCDQWSIDNILLQLEAASDLPSDGTHDPNRECDAVSVGIGFSAVEVKLGPVAAPAPPEPPSPCE